jgi:hypothetical protein
MLMNIDQEITLLVAVKKIYGLTLEEFNPEFQIFLQLPLKEILGIIPDI